ncbi:Trm112p-domain-containing protein [Periconia macrospinosa]|uniref:Trm112p-domain-containing protein n=1 Tax=Periconia macrospinosa TaxID=97972 RepID=A0A2V1DFP2_9PLEO|nr:Trm112p-domain-containing protein [Periconia macrospinosa]
MKLLTLNFLTCAIKTCKTSEASFPLHPRDAELEIVETDLNLPFLKNILPRLMWEEIRTIASELGLPDLPTTAPTREDLVENNAEVQASLQNQTAESAEPAVEEIPSQTAKDLHRILLETCIKDGKLVCGNCAHEYKVMEGVANFLLPGHLV